MLRNLSLSALALVGLSQLAGIGALKAADLPLRSDAPAVTDYNWSGCYLGGYVGAAWQSRDVNAWDPISASGAIPSGTYYHPTANNADSGNFNYNLGGSATGGGTVGCNWQGALPLVFGTEAEGGYMKLAASVTSPYSVLTGNDSTSVTRIGDWQVALTGRAGFAAWDRLLIYLKGGVGFANIHASYVDACAVAPCTPSLLRASGSSDQPFWVGGAGIEYAISQEWSIKGEALVLGMYKLFSVCGPGGGAASGSSFCGKYNVEGVHTAKIGANYHFNAPVIARY